MIALRRELADERVADVVRMDLAEHVRLAHAARDQLRDLGAEIEDQDLVVHGGRRRWSGGLAAAAGAAGRGGSAPGEHSATSCSSAQK